jgi:dienelactone hydrolase
MPDIHRGETVESNPDPDFVSWIKKFDYFKRVKLDLAQCVSHARGEVTDGAGAEVSALGFCWGAWACMKASADEDHPVATFNKIVAVHPAFGIEGMAFGGDEIPVMKVATKRAAWLMLPSKDEAESCKEGGDITNYIIEGGGKTKVFANMNHGWLSRGDCSDAEVRKCCEEALQEIESFLS